jgi:formylglycine-generating enzyme required for sulfatase activity
MCYPPIDQIHLEMTFPHDMLSRTGYRLLTEAEWEYVCRAGSSCRFFFGENEQHSTAFAWLPANSQEMTHPVGQLRPNIFGVFDIQGNVRDWCQDASEAYPNDVRPVSSIPAESIASLPGMKRTFRGTDFKSGGRALRSAQRFSYTPSRSFSTQGFRVVRTISPIELVD